MMINPVVQVVFHKEDPLLCHKIEMWPMLHEFPSKEIRCSDEQRAIRNLKLKVFDVLSIMIVGSSRTTDQIIRP